MNSYFVDSHCHFDFPAFDQDREALWEHCRALGIRQLLVPGVEPAQWQRACSCAERFNGLYYSVGLHPWFIEAALAGHEQSVDDWERGLSDQAEAYLKHPRCVAIGECGLDKTIATPLDLQLDILNLHLSWCKKWQMPIILHCVKAHTELLGVLKKHQVQMPRSALTKFGVIHAFSGSPEIAMEYHKLGFCLGAGGTITYERARKTRRAFASLPKEAIVLETDAPDMPLHGRQGSRNSPEFLPEIASVLADIRGVNVADIARDTEKNFEQVFFGQRQNS